MPNNYRSNLERLTAKLLQDAGIKFKYERTKLKYVSPVVGGLCGECGATSGVGKRRTYLADFTLSGSIIIEAKGKLTSSERTKFLAIRKSNPDWTIIFVFGANNKLNKRKEKRYSDWCEEHGFAYGIKALPTSFIEGS